MISEGACVHVFSSTQPVCLSVGPFTPFAFKGMIDRCDPITVFLSVLGLFAIGVFFLLCFLPREVSLAFSCEAGLVVLNSLNFCFSGKLLISPLNLNASPAG